MLLYSLVVYFAATIGFGFALDFTFPSPRRMQCEEMYFRVSVTATTYRLPRPFGIRNVDAGVEGLGVRNVSGDYTIAGRSCAPSTLREETGSTLQILVHGGGYTRNYWSSLVDPADEVQSIPARYSWIDYAAQKGYATLSIDRLCNGASSKPDGLVQCQLGFQAAVLAEVIHRVRLHGINGRYFDRIVYIGHSLGSLTGNIIAREWPGLVDGLVLTGYSADIGGFLGGAQHAAGPRPTRRGDGIDKSYTRQTNETSFERGFYFGAYSRDVARFDFANTGTTTLGELATMSLGVGTAAGFKGHVFVLTGEDDSPFCGGECGRGGSSKVAGVADLFPRAKSFGFFEPAETGHCVNLHFTGLRSFKVVHDVLGGWAE